MKSFKRLTHQIRSRHSTASFTNTADPVGQITPGTSHTASPAQQSVPRSALNNAWEGTKTILRLVKDSADAFPPLKSTAGGLIALIELIEVRPISIMLSGNDTNLHAEHAPE